MCSPIKGCSSVGKVHSRPPFVSGVENTPGIGIFDIHWYSAAVCCVGTGEQQWQKQEVVSCRQCGADCLNVPYGHLKASISVEGAACPLAVDALVAATALASNDWKDGLLCTNPVSDAEINPQSEV